MTAPTAAALAALLVRARMSILMEAVMTSSKTPSGWRSYAQALSDLQDGLGDRFAAMDAVSPYQPPAGFEAAAQLLQQPVESLPIDQVRARLAQAGVAVQVSPRPRRLSCLDMLALLCDPAPCGAAVTRASLVHDLQCLSAAEVEEYLVTRGVESAPQFIADLQAELAREGQQGAAAGIQPDQGHAASSVDLRDGAGVHRPSVDGGAA